jgi:hypothetical protein
MTEVDGVMPEYAQTAAESEVPRWKQARRASALRGLRRRASRPLVPGLR